MASITEAISYILMRLTHKKVPCVRCGKPVYRRRGSRKWLPPELAQRPPVCSECCTPQEEREIEEAVERHMKEHPDLM
ncbi:MAG: hypothetical protein GF334_05455 [Candidatus Altiarchaeales archaeon]|nr:hypothetical protein [Candidatus Altiarchaeales archaeon]